MLMERKQLAFDLDTKALKTYYSAESWNNAYAVIRKHLEINGFCWQQGSVYISEEPMSSYHVTRILKEMTIKNPWLNACMRDCRETNIGTEHSKNYLFNKDEYIKQRAHAERDNQMHISEDDIRYSKAALDLNEDEFEIEL